MNTKRIEEIQKETAYPDSISVQQALLKVWNECEQERAVKNNAVLPLVMPSLLEIDFNKMRKAKGLTLREVEKSTGISNAYLSQLETGKIKSPGYNVVKALLELYSNEA